MYELWKILQNVSDEELKEACEVLNDLKNFTEEEILELQKDLDEDESFQTTGADIEVLCDVIKKYSK